MDISLGMKPAEKRDRMPGWKLKSAKMFTSTLISEAENWPLFGFTMMISTWSLLLSGLSENDGSFRSGQSSALVLEKIDP